MAHSMTAFARRESTTPQGTLGWELRSVNHRYLEPHLRLPETFRELEPALRETLRRELSRGKIECTLHFHEHREERTLQIDPVRAGQLIEAAETLAARIQQPAPINPLELLAWPGVLATDETDPEALRDTAADLFRNALQELKDSRAREGSELARLIDERLQQMRSEILILREQIPQMLAQQRQKILTRCAEIQLEPDPQRLEQELVLLAQKSDVAEELDRLETHIGEVRRTLNSAGAIGRRLDFLMQELNREANTLGSKAIDTKTTQAAVNLKVLIEQMREQIQNIE